MEKSALIFDSKSDLEFFVGVLLLPKGVGNQSFFFSETGQIRSRCAWHARISLRLSP